MNVVSERAIQLCKTSGYQNNGSQAELKTEVAIPTTVASTKTIKISVSSVDKLEMSSS